MTLRLWITGIIMLVGVALIQNGLSRLLNIPSGDLDRLMIGVWLVLVSFMLRYGWNREE